MKAYSTFASLAGAALLAAAGLAMLLEPEATWLLAANAALGALLVAASAVLDPELFRRYGRWLNAFWGGLLVLAILGMVNFLADRYPQRLDLTEGGLHSLAPLTVESLEALEKEVEALAFMEGGEDEELRGLLEQYAVHGGGRFDFEFVDPDRDPVRTQEYGVRAYNTLVVAAGDERLSITELTEKEITNAMLKVLRDRRDRVYFTVGHGERGSGSLESDLGRLAERLREIDYVVSDSLFLAREARVPGDCRVLIIAGPRSPFLGHEVDAVRRYLDRGGAVLLLADALQETGLEALAGEWGVVTGDDFVIDTSGIGSLFGLDFTIPVVTTYDDVHPIARRHRGGVMTFYELARSVALDSSVVAANGSSAAVLARTSSASWAETDLSVLGEGAGGERTVRLDEADRRGPVGVGAAVADTASGGRLVVFGDADFASNRYFDSQGNGDLALNAVSWLAEDEALISIRPKAPGFNPIALTDTQSEWIFWITVILYPAAIALAGFVVVSRSGRWSLRDLAAAGLGVVLSLGVLVLLNYLGDRYHWRLDLTEDQLFTLAPESLELLREAGDTGKYIHVRTFMSDMEGGRFQEIAEEYGYRSRRFDFETVDPQKDALLVRRYGIRERGTSIVEVTGAGKVVTERFTEQSEEALSNAIRRALAADERVVGFVGGHGEGGLTDVDGEGFSILNGRLKEMNLRIRDAVRPGTDDLTLVQVLAVLGPQSPLSAVEVEGVRRFLERGGDLLLLVDPVPDSGLEDLLLDEYDIDIGHDFVVDLSGLGQLLGTDVSVPVVLRYGDHPITEGAVRGQMSYFPMARSVSAASGGFGVEALAFTDRNAWGESDLAVLSGEEGGSIDFDPETDRPGPLSLAVAVSAEADSAAEGDETRIVVFGDADFARNQYFGQQANGELMAAAVRWLAEGEDGLTIPPKQPRFNPINLVGTAGSVILWISVFALPFAVALSGFVIMLRRGYGTYVSGFVTWLVYNFLALGTWYYILGVIGLGEASLWRGEGCVVLGLLCWGLSYGLYKRDSRAWPPALATLAANAGLAFVVVPEPTLQLVLAGLSIANACILVWIRRDFHPAADAA